MYDYIKKPSDGSSVSRKADITAEKLRPWKGDAAFVCFSGARIGEYEAGNTDGQRIFVAEHSQEEVEGRNLRGDPR